MSVTVLADLDLDRRRARVQRRRRKGSPGAPLPIELEVADIEHEKRLRAVVWRLDFIQRARAAALDAGDADQAAVWLRELIDLDRDFHGYMATRPAA